jgi:O-antigen biosynthesis protein
VHSLRTGKAAADPDAEVIAPHDPEAALREPSTLPEAARVIDGSICVPDYVHERSAWIDHIPFAFWIMQAMSPRCFVELGTHTGVSYLAFCQAAKRLGLATRGYAVDTWEGDPQTGLYGEDIFRALREYHEPRYAQFSRLVRSSFDAAVKHFEDGTIDLLHIDGLHTYDAVKHDFETWRPKLSANAVVLFHDINVREHDFGVCRLWHELAQVYPSFEFLHGHGLGVLGVGTDFPPRVAALFAAGKDAAKAASLRAFFSQFGAQPLTQRFKDVGIAAISLGEEKKALNAEIERQRQAIAQLGAQVQTAENDLRERDDRLAGMQSLERECAILERHITDLNGELTARQGAIDAQQSEVRRLSDALAGRAKELKKLRSSVSWRLTRPLRTTIALARKVSRAGGRAALGAIRLVCRPLRVPLRRTVLAKRKWRFLAFLLPLKDRRVVDDVWLLRKSPWFDAGWSRPGRTLRADGRRQGS